MVEQTIAIRNNNKLFSHFFSHNNSNQSFNYSRLSSAIYFLLLLNRKTYKKHFIRFYDLENLAKFKTFSISKYNKFNCILIRSRKSLKRLRYLNSLNLKRKPR